MENREQRRDEMTRCLGAKPREVTLEGTGQEYVGRGHLSGMLSQGLGWASSEAQPPRASLRSSPGDSL